MKSMKEQKKDSKHMLYCPQQQIEKESSQKSFLAVRIFEYFGLFISILILYHVLGLIKHS